MHALQCRIYMHLTLYSQKHKTKSTHINLSWHDHSEKTTYVALNYHLSHKRGFIRCCFTNLTSISSPVSYVFSSIIVNTVFMFHIKFIVSRGKNEQIHGENMSGLNMYFCWRNFHNFANFTCPYVKFFIFKLFQCVLDCRCFMAPERHPL